MTDLDRQIRVYFEEVNPSFETADLMRDPEPEAPAARFRPSWTTMRRPILVFASAFVVVLVLIGGAVWLLQRETRTVADTPEPLTPTSQPARIPTTAPPVVPSTVAEEDVGVEGLVRVPSQLHVFLGDGFPTIVSADWLSKPEAVGYVNGIPQVEGGMESVELSLWRCDDDVCSTASRSQMTIDGLQPGLRLEAVSLEDGTPVLAIDGLGVVECEDPSCATTSVRMLPEDASATMLATGPDDGVVVAYRRGGTIEVLRSGVASRLVDSFTPQVSAFGSIGTLAIAPTGEPFVALLGANDTVEVFACNDPSCSTVSRTSLDFHVSEGCGTGPHRISVVFTSAGLPQIGYGSFDPDTCDSDSRDGAIHLVSCHDTHCSEYTSHTTKVNGLWFYEGLTVDRSDNIVAVWGQFPDGTRQGDTIQHVANICSSGNCTSQDLRTGILRFVGVLTAPDGEVGIAYRDETGVILDWMTPSTTDLTVPIDSDL